MVGQKRTETAEETVFGNINVTSIHTEYQGFIDFFNHFQLKISINFKNENLIQYSVVKNLINNLIPRVSGTIMNIKSSGTN